MAEFSQKSAVFHVFFTIIDLFIPLEPSSDGLTLKSIDIEGEEQHYVHEACQKWFNN